MMSRERVADEVIEILCRKLHTLPPHGHGHDYEFDYEGQVIVPDVTDDPLDIAEVVMDLEDAFAFNFEGGHPGDKGMETIGDVIDYIYKKVGDRK